MLGFVVGTVCVIGLVKVLRRSHAWHHGGGSCGYRGRRGFGARWMLRALFERLDTTPGQEKAIVSALDELRGNRDIVREEMRQTRADLARVVASALVEDASLEEVFARHDRLLARLRVSLVEALKTVVEALDERQRKELASFLAGGGFFGGSRWGGPGPVWA